MESPHFENYFLADLVSTRVLSSTGTLLGKLWDLIMDLDQPLPEVQYLVYRAPWSTKRLCISWEAVEEVSRKAIILRVNSGVPVPLKKLDLPASHILLREFLLDKQIVDVHGAKVVRVNDLKFLRTNGSLKLVQVDVGLRALLRRLGFESQIVKFSDWFFDYTLKDNFISWNYVQPLADPNRLRLQIPLSKLGDLHPADLADIMEDMDVHERAAVVESLNDDVVAEALEEMDPKVQVSIIRALQPDKAADIIEEMSPDEAADLIADLPADTASGILREMDAEVEETLRDLLAHEEDEAGGLMSSQFLALPPDKTIVDALAHIKKHADTVDVIYYLYVVDDNSRLLGVTNLRELLSAEIFTPIERIMTSRLITVDIDDDARFVAELFAKYGFRAIPVVDEENRIRGVIRFKVLLETLAPKLGR